MTSSCIWPIVVICLLVSFWILYSRCWLIVINLTKWNVQMWNASSEPKNKLICEKNKEARRCFFNYWITSSAGSLLAFKTFPLGKILQLSAYHHQVGRFASCGLCKGKRWRSAKTLQGNKGTPYAEGWNLFPQLSCSGKWHCPLFPS